MTAPAPGDVAPADVTTTPTAPQTDEAELVALREQVASLTAERDAALARADVDVEGDPRRGQAVTFTMRDPITGQQLDGVGVVIHVDDDQAVIVPTASHYLFVPLGDVQVVELED